MYAEKTKFRELDEQRKKNLVMANKRMQRQLHEEKIADG